MEPAVGPRDGVREVGVRGRAAKWFLAEGGDAAL
jgi:hypothetical protein